MPLQKVTLIIGAGASKDINPEIYTGEELIRGIADRITDRNTPQAPYLSKALEEQLNFSIEKRTKFLLHLDNYINSAENPSIDEFLNEVNTYSEFENDKNDFLIIGYVMILAHVFGFEGKGKDSTQKSMFERDTWLSILSKYIDDNMILEQPFSDSLNIITFNYDRIIEYYLLKKYNYSDRIIQFIDNNVHHVYGRAGCLNRLKAKKNGTDNYEIISLFGEDNSKLKEFKEKYVDHIKIIYGKRNDTEGLKSTIEKSDRVFVFGYGFDPINNIRLGLNSCNTKQENFKVNIYSGGTPNYNFKYRREMAKKVRSIVLDADIYYESCVEFLKKCLF
jgi:hypothetical protein